MTDFIDIPGQHGTYRYWPVPTLFTIAFASSAGNYMFMRPTHAGWVPVYIGVARNLSERLSRHEMWPVAQRNGATLTVAHFQPDEARRLTEECDLIAYWNSPCNIQHRTAGTIAGGRLG